MEYNSSEAGTNPTGASPVGGQAQGGLSQNTAAAVAYLTIIPAIIFLVLEPYNKNPFIRFHAFQSLCLGILAFAVQMILMVIPVIGWILIPIVGLAFLAVWIYTVLQASRGAWFKLPVIGNFAEAQAAK
ncbi:MAG: DUF4870 domain-containing protein [Edaphobacter sp.]